MRTFSDKDIKEMFKTFGKSHNSVHMFILKRLRRYNKVVLDIPDTRYGKVTGILRQIIIIQVPKGEVFNESFVKDKITSNDVILNINLYTYCIILIDYMTKEKIDKVFVKELHEAINIYLRYMMSAYKEMNINKDLNVN